MRNILFDISGKIEKIIAKISDPQTLKAVKEILEGETGEQSRYRLVEDMVSGISVYSDQFDEILNYVEKLKEGISEILHN